ncbi:MAG: class IV adenylate cyclase [Spirochaetes bacterium]|nr:class IV adenylate cyclase [Spirochaetota bacterium]
MLEVEIKAYCDDLNSMASKIISAGGTKIEEREERDTYFSHPARNFKDTDEALRIRIAGRNMILTYKGPKIGSRSKTRAEVEVNIDSAESMRLILEKLDFVPVEEVIKNREIYHFEDIEICLDRVHGVGSFVELEKKDTDKDMAEAVLFQLAERLGLERFERRSYLELKLGKK